MYSKGFNNCYILLSNISESLENTKFVAGNLSLRLSLMLYLPIWIGQIEFLKPLPLDSKF